MAPEAEESAWLAQAIAGSIAALERLLVSHYDRLAAEVSSRLPGTVRGVIAPEDVLQETFVVAFREIRSFTPRGPDCFYRWLSSIAQHRLWDMVKGQRAAKRGGGRVALEGQLQANSPKATERSLVGLLELLRVDQHTPSGSVARREAIAAVQVGLAGLKEEYREALRLRYIEGLAVAEVAARMNRTERAVHMLCHRGLERLHQMLGRSSQFFGSR